MISNLYIVVDLAISRHLRKLVEVIACPKYNASAVVWRARIINRDKNK